MREKKLSRVYSFGRTIALLVNTLVLTAGILSCDSQNGGSSANIGKLRLSLYADTTSLKKGVSSNPTKALPDELEKFQTVDDYKIEILQDEKSITTFDRFDQMPSEIELPEGTYTLVASKGDDKPAAFENPFFEGSTSFTVKEGMSTPLDVTCTLANARITVDYTEEFKEAYTTYTVLLKTPFTLEEQLEITQKESRPAYMQVAPDGTDLAIAIRLKKKGEETEKTYPVPTSLKMERRQNIHLIFKPGEGTDGLGLDIWLDNELTEKTLPTDIPDYMWKPFALPELFPENFPEGEQFEIAAGDVEDTNPIVGFIAPAGIGAFHLLQWTEGIVGDTIHYNIATPEGARTAKEAGFDWNIKDVDCLKDVRKPGQLTISGAIANLQGSEEGETYGFGFYANDALPKANYTKRLTFKVRVKPAGAPTLSFPAFPLSIVEGDDMPNDCIVLIRAATGIDPDNTSLTITGKDGGKQYKIKESIEELNALGIKTEITNVQYKLTFSKTFSNKLEVPEGKDEQTYSYKVEMKELGVLERELNIERSFTVKAPVFSLTTTEGDAFAKRIVLRTDMPIGKADKLKFRYKTTSGGWNDVATATSGMEKIGVSHVDTLKDLTPNTEYQIQAVYNGKRYSKEISIQTENISLLIDPGLESWTDRSISGMLNGATPFTDKTLTANDPKAYWSTVNSKTFSGIKCFLGTVLSTYNSVPSTMKCEGHSGDGAHLRSVGWDNSAGNSDVTIYHAAAGKLFMGTYNYNHDNNLDTYNYGQIFTSRPSKVKAWYKYTPYQDDSFKAWAVVVNRAGNNEFILGQGTLVEGRTITDWTPLTFSIKYVDFSKKATHMYIVFSSSLNCSDKESEETTNIKKYVVNGSIGDYTHYEGSNLYIDDIELIYE